MAVFVLVIYTPILRFINENKAFRGIALISPKTQVSSLKVRNYISLEKESLKPLHIPASLPGLACFFQYSERLLSSESGHSIMKPNIIS
jgi:hypothetical protein